MYIVFTQRRGGLLAVLCIGDIFNATEIREFDV
jgi:hypothetical protein